MEAPKMEVVRRNSLRRDLSRFHEKPAHSAPNEHRLQFEADVRGSIRREELMVTSDEKIHLGGRVLNGSRHFCAFFHNEDEELRTLRPFILEGLAAGEKAIHVVNAESHDKHRRRLSAAGIDVAALEQSGQLEIVAWPDDHLLKGGQFNPERALAMIDRLLRDARAQGYRRTRGIGYMNWALQNQIRAGALMAYEAKLNTILTQYDDSIVCSYDLSYSSGAVVLDVMRTHPAALIGGVLQHNPFHIPPEQMLEELRERGEIASDEQDLEEHPHQN
jgi:hypothetical protein